MVDLAECFWVVKKQEITFSGFFGKNGLTSRKTGNALADDA